MVSGLSSPLLRGQIADRSMGIDQVTGGLLDFSDSPSGRAIIKVKSRNLTSDPAVLPPVQLKDPDKVTGSPYVHCV